MNTNIRSKVIHSLKWVALGKAASQLVRWTMTFWVIRLLSPEDYGYVAMADISFSFFTLVLSSLFSPYLIQTKELSKTALKQIFGMVLLVYTSLAGVQYAASDFIGNYFQTSVVSEILKVNAVCFLFMALETLPLSLLARKMDFKKISIVSAIANGIAAVATLTMAFWDYGYWSLIYGEIIFVACRTLLTLYISPLNVMPSLSREYLKPVFSFGGLLSIHALLAYVFVHMDVAIAGRVMSATEIGLFAIALQFALMPQKKILPILKQIAFPAFSSIQDKPEEISRLVLKSQKLCLLITIPIFWGIASVTDFVIPLVLGDKWTAAVTPTILILIVMPFRFCEELFVPALKSQKLVAQMIVNSMIAVAVMFVAINIGANHGATGLALAWSLGFPVAFVWITRRNSKTLRIPFIAIGRLFLRPVFSGLLMMLAVLLTKNLNIEPGYVSLVAQIAAGGLAYTTALLAIDRDSVKELLRLRS